MMMARVRTVGHELKVAWVVIARVAVNVVNVFVTQKRTSQDYFHDDAMFVFAPILGLNLNI
jgi:hypothetical protein